MKQGILTIHIAVDQNLTLEAVCDRIRAASLPLVLREAGIFMTDPAQLQLQDCAGSEYAVIKGDRPSGRRRKPA
jgi:hypothetical protein